MDKKINNSKDVRSIVNPLTGRLISVGGHTWCNLYKKGIVSSNDLKSIAKSASETVYNNIDTIMGLPDDVFEQKVQDLIMTEITRAPKSQEQTHKKQKQKIEYYIDNENCERSESDDE